MIRDELSGTQDEVKMILEAVFADPGIAGQMTPGEIRHTAICGETARDVLQLLGKDPHKIGLLSIGDIALPPFIKPLVLDTVCERAPRMLRKTLEKYGTGYDVPAQGSPEARAAEMRYLGEYYRFNEAHRGLEEALARNTCLTSGGMRGLDDIATGMVEEATDEGKIARFVHPDTSFGTWHAISRLRSFRGEHAELHPLRTEHRNLLHLTPEQVDQFYAEHPQGDKFSDTWYITPVVNPTGTTISPDNLYAVCKAVIRNNPLAVIMLDCVYVRTLQGNEPAELMAEVIQDEEIMQRAIFIESLSKTHGIPGIRAGSYSAVNDQVFRPVQKVNITISAGNGWDKSALMLAFCGETPGETDEIFERDQDTYRRLHRFWGRERKGLHEHLMRSGKFRHLFDDDQSHIRDEDLAKSMGLYLLLKLKKGVGFPQVSAETKCLGCLTKLMSGDHVRFSMGKLTEPTYLKEPI